MPLQIHALPIIADKFCNTWCLVLLYRAIPQLARFYQARLKLISSVLRYGAGPGLFPCMYNTTWQSVFESSDSALGITVDWQARCNHLISSVYIVIVLWGQQSSCLLLLLLISLVLHRYQNLKMMPTNKLSPVQGLIVYPGIQETKG